MVDIEREEQTEKSSGLVELLLLWWIESSYNKGNV